MEESDSVDVRSIEEKYSGALCSSHLLPWAPPTDSSKLCPFCYCFGNKKYFFIEIYIRSILKISVCIRTVHHEKLEGILGA